MWLVSTQSTGGNSASILWKSSDTLLRIRLPGVIAFLSLWGKSHAYRGRLAAWRGRRVLKVVTLLEEVDACWRSSRYLKRSARAEGRHAAWRGRCEPKVVTLIEEVGACWRSLRCLKKSARAEGRVVSRKGQRVQKVVPLLEEVSTCWRSCRCLKIYTRCDWYITPRSTPKPWSGRCSMEVGVSRGPVSTSL